MLVLSRKVGEVIRIGDEIEIQVIDIRRDKCRIGITAPKGMSVHRQEVFEAIQRKESQPCKNGVESEQHTNPMETATTG